MIFDILEKLIKKNTMSYLIVLQCGKITSLYSHTTRYLVYYVLITIIMMRSEGIAMATNLIVIVAATRDGRVKFAVEANVLIMNN